MSVEKKDSINDVKRKCKRKRCPQVPQEEQTKQRTITSEDKNIIVKYKLEETDNENKYLLISGPLYLPKSSVDVTSLSLEKEKHDSKTKQQTDDSLEKEIMSYVFDEPDMEENKFKKWKNSCDKGIFSIQDLLDVCERDPDSILKVCRKNCTADKTVPSLGPPNDKRQNEPLSQIQLTHGAVFGDAKYHFLMVDAATSITRIQKMDKESTHTVERKSTDEAINFADSESEHSEAEEPKIDTEIHKLSILSNKGAENTRKATIEEEVATKHFAIGKANFKSDSNYKKMQNTTDKESDKNEKDDVSGSAKRESTVAWTGVESTHDSISSSSESGMPRAASLEKVVLEATAKAETFRLNVNVKRQHSLLGDIIQQEKKRSHGTRKSTIERDEMDLAKMYKPARCCGLIKGKPIARVDKSDDGSLKKERSTTQILDNEDNYDGSSSSENEEVSLDERMNSVGSVSSYKTRPKMMQTPVYEKNVEMQKYLNNI